MELIQINEKNILLNSRMEELSFSKTNYDSVIIQKGLIATCKKTDDNKLVFSFQDWSFDNIKALDNEDKKRIVYYCGKNPFSKNAKTFLNIVENGDYFYTGYTICSMLTQAALEKIKVPLVGAGGIIVDETKTEIRLLFVPEDLYKFSAGGLSDSEFTRIQAQWLNLTIYDLPAICFMRAVIAYKMITGQMPYKATDPIERNADLLDHKFIPLNYIVNGINKNLSNEINKALKLNVNVVKEPGKKKKGKECADLTPTPDFPLDLLLKSKEIAEDSKLSDEEFNEQVKDFSKRQNAKIKFRRKIRRNKSLIIVGIIAIITGFFIGINIYTTAKDRYSGKGLSSTQIIETYFKSINIKESNLLDELSKGKTLTKNNDAVSSIFVIGKMRQQYGLDAGYESPERWILGITDQESFTKHTTYGVTNLYIDGIFSDINPKLTKKKENPKPILVENNVELKNGDTIIHKIEFDLLQTEGENFEITLIHKKGTITTTYYKDEWKITDIKTDDNMSKIDPNLFLQDYLEALKANNYNTENAVESIREKYNWLPSFTSIIRAKEEIEKERKELSFMIEENATEKTSENQIENNEETIENTSSKESMNASM